MYLIYSFEHNGWWRPASLGYTRVLAEAGRYEYEQARNICADANKHRPPWDDPHEVMVLEGEVSEFLETLP